MVYLVEPVIILSIPDIIIDTGKETVRCSAELFDNEYGEMELFLDVTNEDAINAVTAAVVPYGCEVSVKEGKLVITVQDNDVMCKKLDIWDSEMFRYGLDQLKHQNNLARYIQNI